jgi:hypothetical protein
MKPTISALMATLLVETTNAILTAVVSWLSTILAIGIEPGLLVVLVASAGMAVQRLLR